MSRYYRSFLEESGSLYTARTTALIAATGLSDTTKINAINTFDLAIQSLPFGAEDILYLGFLGSAASNKYNFIDTSKYQLTFNGGWDFTNGMKGNSVNTYATTGWIPSARISNNNNGAIGFYTRNNLGSIRVPMGAYSSSWYAIYPYNNKIYPSINDLNANLFTPFRQLGGFDLSRTSSTSLTALNDANSYTISQTFTSKANVEVYIGTFNNLGTPDSYYVGNDLLCVWASGNGWTSSDILTFSNARLTMLTTLGLNV